MNHPKLKKGEKLVVAKDTRAKILAKVASSRLSAEEKKEETKAIKAWWASLDKENAKDKP